MAWVSQVSVDTTVQADAGWCLWLAEECVGAPHLYPKARDAWDAATDKHADTDYPADAVVALFWDWTAKDGVDYGHVVINTPGQGLFSAPKNWGVHGNDFYQSIDEVSNWLGASFLGWTSDLAGLTLSSWVADAPPAPPAPNERTVAGSPANRRDAPSSQANLVDPVLDAGAVGTFAGWIHGEAVDGNDIWFQGVSGNYFWSGAFTSTSTDGLADLNTPVVIAPVIPDVIAPVAEVPVAVVPEPITPSVVQPVVDAAAPTTSTKKDKPVTVVPPVKKVIPAPTKKEVQDAISATAASAADTEKVNQMTLFSKAFWEYSLERTIKSAAYSANAMLIANGTGLLQADWVGVVSVAGMAALSSVLVALSSFKDI